MGKFLIDYDGVAIVAGVLMSLLVTIILKSIIGNTALTLLPLLASLFTVFLANDTNLISGITNGVISALISVIWVGPLFLILGPIGGILGVMLNIYLIKRISDQPGLARKDTSAESRVSFIKDWLSQPQTNKMIPLVVTVVLGILLIWGVSMGTSIVSDDNQTINQPAKNNTSAISQQQKLESDVKKGVDTFFKNFNSLFKQDGINTGYIISTIKIVNLTPVSPTQVDVTVNLIRISGTGEKFNSTWSGPFYLYNGTWADNGDFVQINTTTLS